MQNVFCDVMYQLIYAMQGSRRKVPGQKPPSPRTKALLEQKPSDKPPILKSTSYLYIGIFAHFGLIVLLFMG